MPSKDRKKFGELLKLAQENRTGRYEYHDNPLNISERLEVMLNYFGVNEKTFGLIIGVSESTVKRWARGQGAGRAHRLNSFQKLESLFLEYSKGPLKIGREYEWYNHKNESLEYFTPIEYMKKHQSAGIDCVKSLLNAIRWGLLS